VRHRVRQHAAVESDLIGLANWIARDSFQTAVDFLDAAETTIRGLSFMPKRGSLKGWRGSRYAGIRTLHVRGYPNHLIVYEVRDDGAYVVAVVHGAQNYGGMVRKRLP
jgi:plasmid stabilization system protein ParE